MNRFATLPGIRPEDLGLDLRALVEELHPICRSITGDGVRKTLDIVGRHVALERHEVPTGTRVFDWTVPREWNIRDAWVANSRGERVIDFRESNLHVLNYSVPIRARMSLEQLRPHLYTLEDHPDWIPYRTSYYREDWGFCLRHRDFEALEEDEYEVVIDSTLEDGHLSYGECFVPGESEDEVLLTTHVCHPSMANDNLSGIAVLTALGAALSTTRGRYGYRLLFIPGTIGSITWLARNREAAGRVRHGLVLAGVGDRGPVSYKKSRRGSAAIDRAVTRALRSREHRLLEFSPYGYDERQFCSPGFDLAVGRFSRSEYGQYPEYHTSADDLDFISDDCLKDSLKCILEVLASLETDERYRNTLPWCEPQLGKRGLYDLPLPAEELQQTRLALLWVLNLSDGDHSLVDIAELAGMSPRHVRRAADALVSAGLLEPAG
jgi:aminopeptidase-like protein